MLYLLSKSITQLVVLIFIGIYSTHSFYYYNNNNYRNYRNSNYRNNYNYRNPNAYYYGNGVPPWYSSRQPSYVPSVPLPTTSIGFAGLTPYYNRATGLINTNGIGVYNNIAFDPNDAFTNYDWEPPSDGLDSDDDYSDDEEGYGNDRSTGYVTTPAHFMTENRHRVVTDDDADMLKCDQVMSQSDCSPNIIDGGEDSDTPLTESRGAAVPSSHSSTTSLALSTLSKLSSSIQMSTFATSPPPRRREQYRYNAPTNYPTALGSNVNRVSRNPRANTIPVPVRSYDHFVRYMDPDENSFDGQPDTRWTGSQTRKPGERAALEGRTADAAVEAADSDETIDTRPLGRRYGYNILPSYMTGGDDGRVVDVHFNDIIRSRMFYRPPYYTF